MDNDRKELNLGEMEQIDGGMQGKGTRRQGTEIQQEKNAKWEKEVLFPTVKAAGETVFNIGKDITKDTVNAVTTVGKAAYNWVTGLFSGDD